MQFMQVAMRRYTKLYVACNFRRDLTDDCDCTFGISKRSNTVSLAPVSITHQEIIIEYRRV